MSIRNLAPLSHSVSPLICDLLHIQWDLQVNEFAVGLSQSVLAVNVILNQLCQCGKLLPTVQVVVLFSALDLNVCDLTSTPSQGAEEESKHTISHFTGSYS